MPSSITNSSLEAFNTKGISHSWPKHIAELIRLGFSLRSKISPPQPAISFADLDLDASDNQHPIPRRVSRAKSPRPLSHDEVKTTKGQHKRENPISGAGIEPPAKRRKIQPSEFSQAITGKMTVMRGRQPKLLIINPNTSTDMTDGMAKLVIDMLSTQGETSLQIELYTAMQGRGSIDNEVHAMESARCVINELVVSDRLLHYDAFLVACYSVHPLVGFIRGELEKAGSRAHVMGIFEASILTALAVLQPSPRDGRFGIVSTGKYWEKVLSADVEKFLGTTAGVENTRFAAVSTTGLNADELHSMPKKKVQERMKTAVKSLMEDNGDVSVIILGCAGMAGLDDVVREALVEKYGEKEGNRVHILDGVKCGIGMLESLLRTVPLNLKRAE